MSKNEFTKEQQERINQLLNDGNSRRELAMMVVRLEAGQPAAKRPRPIVRQIGYTEKQMQQETQLAWNGASKMALDISQEFYVGKMFPYLKAATNLIQLRQNIAEFINHPNTTPESNIKYLTTRFIASDGNERSLLAEFTSAILRAEQTEIALDESLNKEYEPDEVSLIADSAMIRHELIKVDSTKDNKARQLAAIETMKEMFLKTPSKALLRQVEMRSQMNFGGNIKGMKTWRLNLATDWIEVERNNPNLTPNGVIEELLAARTVLAKDTNGRSQLVAKDPDSRMQVRQISSLMTARKRAAKYRDDLLKAYHNEPSDLRG